MDADPASFGGEPPAAGFELPTLRLMAPDIVTSQAVAEVRHGRVIEVGSYFISCCHQFLDHHCLDSFLCIVRPHMHFSCIIIEESADDLESSSSSLEKF